ncbi:MAG: hypothetical protein HYT30_01130 [Parcubacteria group bacterium]|nr:hypothetical protein [Parcubacteria group bacterium]
MAKRVVKRGYLKRHRKDADAPYLAGGVTIGVFSVVSVVLFGASWFQSILVSSNNFASVVSAVLVDLTNADRRGSGAEVLSVNPQLVAAAQAKANDMAQKGYFSHTGPDGREPWAWIQEAGYAYQHAGENLAIQFSDSAEVERAWLNSPKHRENLLSKHFTEIGVATAYGTYQGQPTTFVVQMFGSPRVSQTASAAPTVTKPQAVPTIASAPIARESAVLGVAAALGTDTASPVEGALNDEIFKKSERVSLAQRVMASPHTYFDYIATFIAIVVLMIGAHLWLFEMRQHHMRHSAYAIGLSIALIALIYAADALVFADPVIADTLVTTSV